MALSGKYDFKGIQKAGAAAIEAALATTTWGASFISGAFFKIFKPVEDLLIDTAVNWLANKGLIVLNLGGNWVNGEIDQASLDRSIDEGLKRVQLGRDKLTAAQGKAIDDAVINAADKFIDFGAQP